MARKAATKTRPDDTAKAVKILSEEFELVPPDQLTEHPSNARRGDMSVIGESIDSTGFYGAVVAQRSTNYILAGNHRYRHLREADAEAVPVIWVDVDDDTAQRILVADNRTADLAQWDSDSLAALLKGFDGQYQGTGFTDDAVADFLKSLEGDEQEPSDGSLLALADVTLADPTHQVHDGDVWVVGSHTLVCADVITGSKAWAEHLADDVLFIPYPGPYAALTEKAADAKMLLVQPDPYLAGHLLDKYVSVRGEGSVRRAKPK